MSTEPSTAVAAEPCCAPAAAVNRREVKTVSLLVEPIVRSGGLRENRTTSTTIYRGASSAGVRYIFDPVSRDQRGQTPLVALTKGV